MNGRLMGRKAVNHSFGRSGLADTVFVQHTIGTL